MPFEMVPQRLICNDDLYYSDLILRQWYSRYPGPHKPRYKLRLPYKPCLPERKEALRNLIMKDNAQLEKDFRILGIGFVTTHP